VSSSIIAPLRSEFIKCFEYFSDEETQEKLYFISVKEEGYPMLHYGYYMAKDEKSHYLNTIF